MSQPDISRPRFSYPPLLQSDGAIRLVILQPGTSWTAPALPDSPPQLECRLWSTTVTASRYEVLAYTRGTEERNRTIIVEDAPFNVTERLWDALHRIRADDVRYFWIDVISIDETNLEEKS
ncbi:MAG: hypothetical protein MMC33_010890, partial [Icmadophila ericetorum]|nr:hypothetical protein [Icmadophila ericetorum]